MKSAVLLAGLHAEGTRASSNRCPPAIIPSGRSHAFGARVGHDGRRPGHRGGQRLYGRELTVPGDISSAAFWMVAAAALAGSEVTIEEVGLNPSRTAILDVLRRFGAVSSSASWRVASRESPWVRLSCSTPSRATITIAPDEVPGVIDELPVLAALATHGGELAVTGAQELRVKESDRISALADGLRRMGADIEEQPDGFHVAATGACAAARWTPTTIIGWPWRSPLRRSAPRDRRRFTTPARRRCRIQSSFPCSNRCGREGRQALSRRIHGGRQDHRRSGARPPHRLARRRHRPAHRGTRAAQRDDDIFAQDGEAYFRAPSARSCSSFCRNETSSSPPGAVRSWIRTCAPRCWTTAPWPGSTCRSIVSSSGSPGRPSAAGRRPGADGAALHAPRLAYAQAHVRVDAGTARRRDRRDDSWTGSATRSRHVGHVRIWSSATFTRISRRSTPRCRRPVDATTASSCSAIWSATAPTPMR